MHRIRLLDTAYASLAVYVEYLLGLVASIVIARALQPAEMGVYGLLVWIAATAIALANAGIALAAIKFVAELRGAGQPEECGKDQAASGCGSKRHEVCLLEQKWAVVPS